MSLNYAGCVVALIYICINGAACNTPREKSHAEFFCIAGEQCTVGVLEPGRSYYIAKECNGRTGDTPFEISTSVSDGKTLATFRWKVGHALPKGKEAWVYSFCKEPQHLVAIETTTLVAKFMVINKPELIFHYLGRNNELTIAVAAPAGPKLSMRVGFSLSNVWDAKSLDFTLENVGGTRYGSIYLGDWIASHLQPNVEFFTLYVDIMSPHKEGHITNYMEFKAFHMNAITRSHNVLTDKVIILQLVGVAPKLQAKYSVQLVDATNANTSICGHDNTLWYKMGVPFLTRRKDDERYTVFALPKDLYGQTVLICANVSKQHWSFYQYNIPIHVVTLGSSKIPGNLIEFQSDSLGMADITFSKDIHPMSEIMLIEHKTEDARKRVFTYLNPQVYPLGTAYPNQQPTTKRREFTQWYLSHHTALSPNYENTELWSSNPRESVYYKKGAGVIFYPKLSITASNYNKPKWSIGRMQFKKLFFETTPQYTIMLCDRWKHPYCLSQSDFDEPIGYVLKCPFEREHFEAAYQDGVLHLTFATSQDMEPPLIKLVLIDNARYANMDTVCQRTGTLVPFLEKLSSNSSRSYGKRHHLKYSTLEFDMGSSYCVCFLEIGIKTPENTGWKRFFKNIDQAAKRSYEWKRWKFFKLIYTPSITPKQRLTLTKGEDGNDDLFFPTTNRGLVVVNGIYLTPNLKTECRSADFYDKSIDHPIKAGQSFPAKKSTAQKPNFFDEVTVRLSPWWNPYGSRTTNASSGGTWLLHYTGQWTRTNTNLVLNLPGKKEERIQKMLKVCICSYGKCTDGGNYVDSNVERYYFNRYHGDRGIYTDLLADGIYCMYNKMVLECYEGNKNIGEALRKSIDVPIPQYSRIKHLSYDKNERMLIMAMDYALYIYSIQKRKLFKLNTFSGIERIFSVAAATYVLTTQGTLSALINEYNLASKLKGMNSSDPYYWTAMTATWSTKALQETELKLEKCTMPIRQVSVVESAENNQVELFFIDANNFVHYYTHKPGTTKNAHTSHVTSFPVKTHLPHATGDLILRAKAITINEERHVLLFLYNKGDVIIKVFIQRANVIIFYSDIEASPNMVDFSIPNTDLLALNINVMPRYKISQYMTLVRLDKAMTLRLYYPTWIHHMQRDVEYVFTPTHISGHFRNFAVKDPKAFAKTGLTINSSTGVITGKLTFVGKMDIEVIAQGYLGQTSTVLQLKVSCAIGYQPGQNSNCVKCPIGTFGDSSETGECLKCSDLIKDSTTKEPGAMIPSSCVCKPGYYLNLNKCEKCPGGTYSNIYGASRCIDGCKLNETGNVTGATSPNELNCFCKPGFYKKKKLVAGGSLEKPMGTKTDSRSNTGVASGTGGTRGEADECVPCEVGSYCLGGVYQPAQCPSRMSTASIGASSLNDCMCEPGYELKSGACRPCHQTSYKETLGNHACSSCTNMESIGGTIFSSKVASASRADCRFCKPGYFFDTNRLSCINCPALNFCPGADLPPLVCPSNTLTQGKLVTASSDCFCTRGHGLHSLGRGLLFLGNPCAPCPLNTFQHVDGYSLPCMPCPSNMYTASSGSSSLSECLPLPGYYSLVGETLMHKIVSAMETDHTATKTEDLKISCAKGVVLHQSFSISVLQPSFDACLDLCKKNAYCKWAYYMQKSSSIPHREPILLSLDSNTFIDYWPCKLTMLTDRLVDVNLTEKFSLEPLSFDLLKDYNTAPNILCKIERKGDASVVAEQLLIAKCPRNYFCPGGTLSKSKCPDNSITLSTGATRITDCLCLPGYEPTETATSVVCKACKRGTFKNTISNGSCTVCPIGMTTSDVGSVNQSQCTCISNLYAQLRHWPGDEKLVDERVTAANIFSKLAEKSASLATTSLTLPVTTSAPIECKSCPRGHYCSGEWLNIGDMYIHTPPASCPAGAAVPKLSHRASSISKCLCVPGYGIGTRITENFASCSACPPGTFKGTYENTSCLGRCAPYAITLPGAESIHDCFCTPGRFMTVRQDKHDEDEYDYECVKCIEGAVCPGGFRNVSKRAVHANEDYDETGAKKGITLYEHSIPYPRMGYTAIFKRNSVKRGMHESKRNRSIDLLWKPNLPNDGYRTSPPKEHELEEFDHIPDLHPCVYASRCRGTTDYACQQGSEGYSCSNCQAGSDVKYFQSGCSQCKSRPLELLWLVAPRVCFLMVLVATSWLAKVGTINGEFSLLPLLKIWYHFTISVLALGLSPITSVSSMRNFYHTYKSILYKPIVLFANVERLGCWTHVLSRIIRLLNVLGLPKSIFDGSAPLEYVQIWYLERFLAIFKPLLDVLLLLLYHLVVYAASRLLAKHKKKFTQLQARILHVTSKLRKQQDQANNNFEGAVENSFTLENLMGKNTLDDVYASFYKANKPCSALLTQVILALVLHLPSLWLNSLSLFWCRGISYKKEPVLMVLLHLPHQECHSRDPLYWLGVRLGIGVLGASLFCLLALLLSLAGGTKSIAYNPRSWRGIFQSGYHSNFIWWDVLLLARQFASMWLVVAQYDHDPKGASEHVRVSGFIVVCIVYASLHLAFSPYDCRSYNSLNILETQTLFVSFVLGLLIQGSFYYDLSYLAAVPLFLCFYIHISIVWCIIVQIGLFKSITSPLNTDGDSSDFVGLLLGHLPQVSNAKDAGVYYDYKDDTLVLEQRLVQGLGRRFFQRLSRRGRILMDAAKAFVKTSRAFNQNSRRYLVQCIELAIDRGNILDKNIVLSNAWMYFVVRFSYWYTHCMHINLALGKDENAHVSDKDFILKLSFMHLFPQHNEALDTLVCDFLLKVPLGTLKSHNVIHHHHHHSQGQMGICNGQCEPLKTDNLSLRVTHIAECLLVDSLYMDFYDLGPMSLTEMYMALLALGHFTRQTLSRIFTIFKLYSMYKRDPNHYEVVRRTMELGQSIDELQRELKSKGKRGSHLHKQHMMTNQLQDVEHEIGELNAAIDQQKQVIMAARAAAAVALNLHLGVDAIVANDISNEDILKAIECNFSLETDSRGNITATIGMYDSLMFFLMLLHIKNKMKSQNTLMYHKIALFGLLLCILSLSRDAYGHGHLAGQEATSTHSLGIARPIAQNPRIIVCSLNAIDGCDISPIYSFVDDDTIVGVNEWVVDYPNCSVKLNQLSLVNTDEKRFKTNTKLAYIDLCSVGPTGVGKIGVVELIGVVALAPGARKMIPGEKLELTLQVLLPPHLHRQHMFLTWGRVYVKDGTCASTKHVALATTLHLENDASVVEYVNYQTSNRVTVSFNDPVVCACSTGACISREEYTVDVGHFQSEGPVVQSYVLASCLVGTPCRIDLSGNYDDTAAVFTARDGGIKMDVERVETDTPDKFIFELKLNEHLYVCKYPVCNYMPIINWLPKPGVKETDEITIGQVNISSVYKGVEYVAPFAPHEFDYTGGLASCGSFRIYIIAMDGNKKQVGAGAKSTYSIIHEMRDVVVSDEKPILDHTKEHLVKYCNSCNYNVHCDNKTNVIEHATLSKITFRGVVLKQGHLCRIGEKCQFSLQAINLESGVITSEPLMIKKGCNDNESLATFITPNGLPSNLKLVDDARGQNLQVEFAVSKTHKDVIPGYTYKICWLDMKAQKLNYRGAEDYSVQVGQLVFSAAKRVDTYQCWLGEPCVLQVEIRYEPESEFYLSKTCDSQSASAGYSKNLQFEDGRLLHKTEYFSSSGQGILQLVGSIKNTDVDDDDSLGTYELCILEPEEAIPLLGRIKVIVNRIQLTRSIFIAQPREHITLKLKQGIKNPFYVALLETCGEGDVNVSRQRLVGATAMHIRAKADAISKRSHICLCMEYGDKLCVHSSEFTASLGLVFSEGFMSMPTVPEECHFLGPCRIESTYQSFTSVSEPQPPLQLFQRAIYIYDAECDKSATASGLPLRLAKRGDATVSRQDESVVTYNYTTAFVGSLDGSWNPGHYNLCLLLVKDKGGSDDVVINYGQIQIVGPFKNNLLMSVNFGASFNIILRGHKLKSSNYIAHLSADAGCVVDKAHESILDVHLSPRADLELQDNGTSVLVWLGVRVLRKQQQQVRKASSIEYWGAIFEYTRKLHLCIRYVKGLDNVYTNTGTSIIVGGPPLVSKKSAPSIPQTRQMGSLYNLKFTPGEMQHVLVVLFLTPPRVASLFNCETFPWDLSKQVPLTFSVHDFLDVFPTLPMHLTLDKALICWCGGHNCGSFGDFKTTIKFPGSIGPAFKMVPLKWDGKASVSFVGSMLSSRDEIRLVNADVQCGYSGSSKMDAGIDGIDLQGDGEPILQQGADSLGADTLLQVRSPMYKRILGMNHGTVARKHRGRRSAGTDGSNTTPTNANWLSPEELARNAMGTCKTFELQSRLWTSYALRVHLTNKSANAIHYKVCYCSFWRNEKCVDDGDFGDWMGAIVNDTIQNGATQPFVLYLMVTPWLDMEGDVTSHSNNTDIDDPTNSALDYAYIDDKCTVDDLSTTVGIYRVNATLQQLYELAKQQQGHRQETFEGYFVRACFARLPDEEAAQGGVAATSRGDSNGGTSTAEIGSATTNQGSAGTSKDSGAASSGVGDSNGGSRPGDQGSATNNLGSAGTSKDSGAASSGQGDSNGGSRPGDQGSAYSGVGGTSTPARAHTRYDEDEDDDEEEEEEDDDEDLERELAFEYKHRGKYKNAYANVSAPVQERVYKHLFSVEHPGIYGRQSLSIKAGVRETIVVRGTGSSLEIDIEDVTLVSTSVKCGQHKSEHVVATDTLYASGAGYWGFGDVAVDSPGVYRICLHISTDEAKDQTASLLEVFNRALNVFGKAIYNPFNTRGKGATGKSFISTGPAATPAHSAKGGGTRARQGKKKKRSSDSGKQRVDSAGTNGTSNPTRVVDGHRAKDDQSKWFDAGFLAVRNYFIRAIKDLVLGMCHQGSFLPSNSCDLYHLGMLKTMQLIIAADCDNKLWILRASPEVGILTKNYPSELILVDNRVQNYEQKWLVCKEVLGMKRMILLGTHLVVSVELPIPQDGKPRVLASFEHRLTNPLDVFLWGKLYISDGYIRALVQFNCSEGVCVRTIVASNVYWAHMQLLQTHKGVARLLALDPDANSLVQYKLTTLHGVFNMSVMSSFKSGSAKDKVKIGSLNRPASMDIFLAKRSSVPVGSNQQSSFVDVGSSATGIKDAAKQSQNWRLLGAYSAPKGPAALAKPTIRTGSFKSTITVVSPKTSAPGPNLTSNTHILGPGTRLLTLVAENTMGRILVLELEDANIVGYKIIYTSGVIKMIHADSANGMVLMAIGLRTNLNILEEHYMYRPISHWMDMDFGYIVPEGYQSQSFISLKPLCKGDVFEAFTESSKNAHALSSIGLKLDADTGKISGTITKSGSYTFTILGGNMLLKVEAVLNLTVNCPPSHQVNILTNRCEMCPVGTFRNNEPNDVCSECKDWRLNTTTKLAGGVLQADCQCAAGFYLVKQECVPCPQGKYKSEVGDSVCSGSCDANMVSTVVGATSLKDLKCECSASFFNIEAVNAHVGVLSDAELDKLDLEVDTTKRVIPRDYTLLKETCLPCKIGFYCPGAQFLPVPCPDGTSTKDRFSFDFSSCMCDVGHGAIAAASQYLQLNPRVRQGDGGFYEDKLAGTSHLTIAANGMAVGQDVPLVECTRCSHFHYKKNVSNEPCQVCPGNNATILSRYQLHFALKFQDFGMTSDKEWYRVSMLTSIFIKGAVVCTLRLAGADGAECRFAVAGFYMDSSLNAATACPLDFYCLGLDAAPIRCGLYAITTTIGATSPFDCGCPIGFGVANGIRSPIDGHIDCAECPIGFYQHIDGIDGPCLPCPLNTSTIAKGSKSLYDCIPQKGYFMPRAAKEPKASVVKGGNADDDLGKFSAIDLTDKDEAHPADAGTHNEQEVENDDLLDGELDNVDADARELSKELEPGHLEHIKLRIKGRGKTSQVCTSVLEEHIDAAHSHVVYRNSKEECYDACRINVYCRGFIFGNRHYAHSSTSPFLNHSRRLFNGITIVQLQSKRCTLLFFSIKIKSVQGNPNGIAKDDKMIGTESGGQMVTLCTIINEDFSEFLYNPHRCPMDHYCSGTQVPTPCPPNSRTLHTGETLLDACKCVAGYEPLNDGSGLCRRCDFGRYKPNIANTPCRRCPEKMKTLLQGATSVAQCACSPGYFARPIVDLKPAHIYKKMQNGTLEVSNDASLVKRLGSFQDAQGNDGTLELNLPGVESFVLLSEPLLLCPKDEAGITGHVKYTCERCPPTRFCPGGWAGGRANLQIHNYAYKCPSGSGVPRQTSLATSVKQCLCLPGYRVALEDVAHSASGGLFPSGFGEDSMMETDARVSRCKFCDGGMYKESLENSSCSGRCMQYATTYGGSVSKRQCFCHYGRYMTLADGQLTCAPCVAGAICPGGLMAATMDRLRQDVTFKDITIAHHSKPQPRYGYFAAYKHRAESIWSPAHQPVRNVESLPMDLIDFHPCTIESRCDGQLGDYCSVGAGGYLCAECRAGYDSVWFRGPCTRCFTLAIELWHYIQSKAPVWFLALLLLLLWRRKLVVPLALVKIWLDFLSSMVPYGMLHKNSPSSLSSLAFRYQRIFGFVERMAYHVRLACFVKFATPRHWWYYQRLVQCLVPFFDAIFLYVAACLLCLIASGFRWVSSVTCEGCPRGRGRLGPGGKKRPAFELPCLYQFLLVMFYLNFQSIMIELLQMQWCVVVAYKREEPISVLLFFPGQVCTFDDVWFMGTFMASLLAMALLLLTGTIGLVLVYAYFQGAKCSREAVDYSTSDFMVFFACGHRRRFMAWDALLFLRKFFVALLSVAQQSTTSLGSAEVVRALGGVLLTTLVTIFHMMYSPFDVTSDNILNRFELVSLCLCNWTAFMILGSFSYEFVLTGFLPLLTPVLMTVVLAHHVVVEYGYVAQLRPRLAKSASILKSCFWKICRSLLSWERNALIYFDPRRREVILETCQPRVHYHKVARVPRGSQGAASAVARASNVQNSLQGVKTTFTGRKCLTLSIEHCLNLLLMDEGRFEISIECLEFLIYFAYIYKRDNLKRRKWHCNVFRRPRGLLVARGGGQGVATTSRGDSNGGTTARDQGVATTKQGSAGTFEKSGAASSGVGDSNGGTSKDSGAASSGVGDSNGGSSTTNQVPAGIGFFDDDDVEELFNIGPINPWQISNALMGNVHCYLKMMREYFMTFHLLKLEERARTIVFDMQNMADAMAAKGEQGKDGDGGDGDDDDDDANSFWLQEQGGRTSVPRNKSKRRLKSLMSYIFSGALGRSRPRPRTMPLLASTGTLRSSASNVFQEKQAVPNVTRALRHLVLEERLNALEVELLNEVCRAQDGAMATRQVQLLEAGVASCVDSPLLNEEILEIISRLQGSN